MAKREKLKPLPAKPRTRKPKTAHAKELEVVAERRSFYAVIIARYLQLIRGRK